MNKVELEREINEYGRKVATLILQDYRESLGTQKELYIYQLTTIDFITLDETKKEQYAIYLNIPENVSSYELAQNDLKNKLPYALFSILIHPNKEEEPKSELESLMVEDLTTGLRELYTKRFCEKHQLPLYLKTKKASTGIASMLINHNIPEMDEDKMVFQTNYLYMKQMYSISTHGHNLVHDYDEKYLTPRELEQLKAFLKKYFSVEKMFPDYVENNSHEYVVSHLTNEILKNFKEEEASVILEEFSKIFVKEKDISRNIKKTSSGHLAIYFLLATCLLFTSALIFLLFH